MEPTVHNRVVEKDLGQAFDQLAGSLVLTDFEGKVVYSSRSMEERTGYQVAEIVGNVPGRLWGGRMEKGFYNSMWNRIKDQGLPFAESVTNVRKDGWTYSDTLRTAPIFDTENKITFFLGLMPEHGQQDRADQLSREFQTIFSARSTAPAGIIDWLLKWLGAKNNFNDALIQQAKRDLPVFSLTDFFERYFVLPTKNKYVVREQDTTLVALAKQNPEAFQKIYLKYRQDVYNYFRRHLGHDQVIEDLTQEVFLRALKYLPGFKNANASYKTYILRIAHNLLINYYREKKTLSLDEATQIKDKRFGHYRDVVAKENLWRGVAELSESEQQVIEMKYQEDMSVRDIALFINKTENAVKLLLSRGRKKLRDQKIKP